MKAFDRRVRVIKIAVWVFIVAVVMVAVANIAEAVLILRGTPEATEEPTTFPTAGTTAFPSAILKTTPEPLKFRMGIPVGFETDPAFWQMLTPNGQAVLAGVTVTVSDEPRHYACPLVWEVGTPTPTPAVCTYYGSVYDGATNTIALWGEAAQANPDILRHEALHALDAAGDRPASESGLVKLAAGELAREAEALYNAGGGTWFRPQELFAMVPLVVGWDFSVLTPAICAYYAEWFLQAARICPVTP